ncbi:hypothetical protein Btru_028770 [Bulinus truncatus]|nr:hypothetical protein Btru_028770 [Bulinus truncatus]
MSQWCTVKRSVTAVALCLMVCMAQSLYVIEVYRVNSGNVCILREKYKGTWGLFYESYFQPTVLSLLPIVLLIILNFLIFKRLHKVSKFQKQMTEAINKNKVKQQKQINRMLMASSICLFICLMPDILYQYINRLIDRGDQGVRSRIILMNVFGVLKIYNCAANFFLYIIAANKFRTELLMLISCNHYGGASSTDKSTTPPNKNVNYI